MTVAVLVNLRARHGSEAVGRRIREILPLARVAVTRSLEDARTWVRDELTAARPEVLLSGGGDGTAVALLNELRDHGVTVPAFGLLPLGTGNGWARATGDVGKRAAFRGLSRLARHGAPPLRHFGLVETEGRITPFAGTGWDAEILADYKAIQESVPGAVRGLSARGGYMQSLFTRTIPRHLFGYTPPRVRLVNLGEPAFGVTPEGRAVPIPGAGPGAVLYDGPISVGGAATTEELGLGFRAFPFAHLVPGRMNVRIYAASALHATVRMPWLWRGAHPLPDDHHFFVTRCRFEFDRPVPFEIGGDLAGERTEVEMSYLPDAVPMIDWRRLKGTGSS
ncbi:MAG: diacylglycerol kinase [Myxococcales bacterium]|nr:diacylglycerol kinase [Myxococcales bacterium]